MFKRLVTAGLVFGMAALAPPASAQVPCADRDHVAANLAAEFGEKLLALGLSSETELFEIWSSDDTGTWTILKTMANGRTCIMAHGDMFITGFDEPDPNLPAY